MKRLAVEQEVALSVGDATVDCRVAALSGGEAALAPLDPADGGLLPAASAGASLVFMHGGRLVMLRGAMYRATGEADLRFAEKSGGAGPVVAEQRRKAARLPITLPATIRQLDDEGTPFGEQRQLVTRDISIGGFSPGAHVRFELILTSGEMLSGTAVVVRAASEMSGLRFEQLAPVDRVKLAGFLAGRQSNRGPRAAAAAR
jgi:hypothetical protein